MKYLLIYLLTFLLVGCISNQTTIDQNKLEKKRLTKKEELFVKQLETRGYSNIDIIPPTIGDDSPGFSVYHFSASSQITQSKNNLDSIQAINYEIAKELYVNVIEDSILFEIGSLIVIVEMKSSKGKSAKIETYEIYRKNQLEHELKLKVIKKNDGTFERLKIQ